MSDYTHQLEKLAERLRAESYQLKARIAELEAALQERLERGYLVAVTRLRAWKPGCAIGTANAADYLVQQWTAEPPEGKR